MIKPLLGLVKKGGYNSNLSGSNHKIKSGTGQTFFAGTLISISSVPFRPTIGIIFRRKRLRLGLPRDVFDYLDLNYYQELEQSAQIEKIRYHPGGTLPDVLGSAFS